MSRPEPYLDIPHPGLPRTLLYIKEMAQESIEYMASQIPSHINQPEPLFYWLKERTNYRKDPFGKEYIQLAQTLLEDSNGEGDCDCFTVTALASLYVIGERDLFTNLAGNERRKPSHIYCSYNSNGINYVFDLTNNVFDFERPYKFYQRLKTVL